MAHFSVNHHGSAINYRMIWRILGQLLIVEAAFMLLPLAVSAYYGEKDFLPFLLILLLTLASGMTMNMLIRPEKHSLRRRDGMLLASVAWVMFSLFGMLPYIFASPHLDVSEAFFETMSGFTTTGATVIRDVESCGKGLLLWRALTQWIGGLGIVLFTLTFIPSLNNNGSLMLFHAEATGITHDKLAARISRTAKKLWALYSVFSLVLVLMLWVGPMNLFDSFCHAMSTISTGGFSTKNDGIAAYHSPYIKSVLTIFMFIGGVSFGLIIASMKNSWRLFWKNDVFRYYVSLIALLFMMIVCAILALNHFSGWQSISIDPLFHIVSAMTSTGFSAGDWEGWGVLVLTLTFFMMYVGACAGSTTGGAKVDRLVYLVKNFVLVVRQYVRPRLLRSVNVNGQSMNSEKDNEVVAFLFIYSMLIVVGGVVLVAEGFPIVDAFFSSVSCISNNGLGAGVTGIMGSYDFLPAFGKWVMSLLMLAGRLEIITLFALMVPDFWRK